MFISSPMMPAKVRCEQRVVAAQRANSFTERISYDSSEYDGAIFSLFLIGISGCGTVINGVHQDLAITSTPGGATVTVDGQDMGTTPIVASVWRKHAHVVKVERPGYHPVETSVVPELTWWAWGNVLVGGLIGLTIDAWTGGLYELSHEHISATFPASFEKTPEPLKPVTMSAR